MSKARLVITAVVVEGRPVREVSAAYGVARSWIYELLARYRAEGEAAFEPRSRRPHSQPTTIPITTAELIIRLRRELSRQGLLDLHAVAAQMVDRAFDWPSPDEAEIASAGLHRKPRDRLWFKSGSMDVELLSTEAVHRNTVRLADELRAEDIAVEGV